jgi:Ca2+-binding EF-hand superfamily protein
MNSISNVGSSLDPYAMQSLSQCQQNSKGQFAAKVFSQLDTNGDGTVDKAEFSTAMSNFAQVTGNNSADTDSIFSKLDANGDGKISPQELQQATHQMHHAHMHHHAKQTSGGDNSNSDGDPNAALNSFIADMLQTYQNNSADPVLADSAGLSLIA